ncbi:MAG: flagellar hook-length control protein FliK [Leptolyngbya sp. PLA3]|nr:MAG: flagellar hook-length control protein FliK [Cyanobacteria bacterium CYA]MCE7968867.1 flagellar hook-length control protein FliK [Leptolyngbya sp. PL-A3]
MIEQAGGSGGPKTEVDQVRTSSTTPLAAQGFAGVFADLLDQQAQKSPGIAQVVRDELKNPNQVNLASIAAAELTSPSEPQAADSHARSQTAQTPHKTPPSAPVPPSARSTGAAEQSGATGPRSAGRLARADARPAQTSPSQTQSRPSHAQSSPPAQPTAAVAPHAPPDVSTPRATASTTRGSTRIDALAGLSRPGPRIDPRAAAAAFKKHSPPIFHAEKQHLTSQVSRSLASIIARGGGKLSLRLSPQALGDVRVDVEVREGSARALFRTETESACDLLKSNLDALRHALETRGLRVERLEVIGPHSESAAPASESDRIDGRESAGSGQQQPWHGGSTARARRASAEADGGTMFEPAAEPGSETGPCVVVRRSIEGVVLRLDAIA